MNEEGKIFVGGLSWDTTNEGLRAYFVKFGTVKDSVVMTDPNTQKPRGFGFITFEDSSLVPSVCAQEHFLDGKKVDPKPATSRSAPDPTNDRVKKVFIGGISQGTSVEELRQYFCQFGAVTNVELKHDRDSNRMRGFGFVDFDSEDTVDKLVETHFHNINGKSVEVKKAAPNHSRGSAPRGGAGYGGGNQGYYQQQQQQPSAGSYGYGYGSQQQAGYAQGWYNGQAYSQAQGQPYYGQPQSYASQQYGQPQGYGGQAQSYGYEANTYGKDNRQPSQANYSSYQQAGGSSWYGYTDNSAAAAAGGASYGSYQGTPANSSYTKGQQRYQPYSR